MADSLRTELFNETCLREHGRILTGRLAHYCPDWDYMTIDETCPEMSGCTCSFTKPPEKSEWTRVTGVIAFILAVATIALAVAIVWN